MPNDRFFARLSAWFQGAPSGPSSAKKKRQKMNDRQQEIGRRWEDVVKVYEHRLKALSERLRSLDDAAFQREASGLLEAQHAVLNVLRRIELAEQDTRSLINEWRDWERMSSYADVPGQEREERQELLRSELALRGVEVGVKRVEVSNVGAHGHAPSVEPIAEGDAYVTASVEDHLEDWDEIRSQIVPETVAYWNDRMKDIIDADEASPEALYTMVKRFREAQAEQRLLDRLTGYRRDNRLEAFG